MANLASVSISIKEGWICPKCGRVLKPTVRQCFCESCTCAICGNESDFYIYMPFGTLNEDEIVCSDCVSKNLDHLIKKT